MKKIGIFKTRLLIAVLAVFLICGVAPGVFAEEAPDQSGEAIVQTEEKADSADPSSVADADVPAETEQAALTEGTETEAGSVQNAEASLQDEPAAVRVDLTGSVSLTGMDLTAGMFSFTVNDVTDRNNIKPIGTYNNDKEGKYSFTLPFYDEGIYSFEITQSPNTPDPKKTAGVILDTHVYPFKVVTEKNTEGKLTYKVFDDNNKQIDVESSSVFRFTNQSKSNSDSSNNSNNNNSNNSNNSNNNGTNTNTNTNTNTVDTASAFNSTGKLTGKVNLTGKTLTKDEFSFTMKDTTESTLAAERKTWTVKNESNGAFSFEAIQYDKAGEYTYSISQDKGSESGITYDTNVYNATVKVTAADDGTFKSELTKLTKGNNNTDALSNGIVFNNQYKSSSASSGTKSTTGNTNNSNNASSAAKSSSNPKTGDASTVGLYSALLAGFVVVLLVTLFSFRKRKGHSK